ncbi:hypothetical protein D3C78_1660940 [compost metagenome]
MIGVRVGAQSHLGPFPRRLGEFLAQYLGSIDLHYDLGIKVPSGIEFQVRVALAGKTVDAGVAAAAIGVDRPLERHV